jgi:tetratricopeptide (TPR) repeat protein
MVPRFFFNNKQLSIRSFFTGIITLLPFILFTLMGFTSSSQNSKDNFEATDKSTYLLYSQKNWDSLIQVGNRSIKSGVDYYYLRLRIGIAYYNKENYLKAAQHLEKALKFNASDATAMEYLYYSYMFSGRKREARVLSSKFTASLENKLQTGKIDFFEKLHIETGPTFSNNIEKNERKPSIGSNNMFRWEQDMNDDKYYAHFGFELNLSKRISTYLGYNYLTISKLKQINTPAIPYPGNNNANGLHNYKYDLFQNGFYGNMKFVLGKGFMLTPAYYMLNVKYSTIYPVITPPPLIYIDVIESDTSFLNHVTSLALNKSVSIFNLGITTSWSNLNNKYQYQLGGLFTWFPAGNLNIYTTSTFISAWEEKNNRLVFNQLVGGKVLNKLWIEGTITLGEMVNFNEKNAFIVHNSGDKIKFRTGINFIVLLSAKVELSIRYIYLQEQGYWISSSVEGGSNISQINYQNNTIIGGLKWTL